MTKFPDPGCVVKVGDGRGFIIEHRISTARWPKPEGMRLRPFVERRLVVTAAHCLSKLPPAHAFSLEEERTYLNLLGRLDGERNVAAACLFADPIADIAVLGTPDGQVLPDEAEGYDAMVDDAPVLSIGHARNGKGWLLGLDRPEWIPTKLQVSAGHYGTSLAIGPSKPGMSGSPILNCRGQAVGIVALGSETGDADGNRREEDEAWGQPILTRNLPGWLLT